MKLLARTFCLAVLIGVGWASVASAATIYQVMEMDFDPTTQYWLDEGYGKIGHALTWDNLREENGKVYFDPGRPHPNLNPQYEDNPEGLIFTYSTGGDGGNGAGEGALPTVTTYTLGNDKGGDWKMDFSMLLFDPNFTGDEVTVELWGSVEGTDYVKANVAAEKVKAGIMLTWHIDAPMDADLNAESVFVRVTADGNGTYPAGFFYDDAVFSMVPEPATIGLVALGLAGVAMARRKK